MSVVLLSSERDMSGVCFFSIPFIPLAHSPARLFVRFCWWWKFIFQRARSSFSLWLYLIRSEYTNPRLLVRSRFFIKGNGASCCAHNVYRELKIYRWKSDRMWVFDCLVCVHVYRTLHIVSVTICVCISIRDASVRMKFATLMIDFRKFFFTR